MALNDGQMVALLTAAGTVVVGTIGYVSARYGTFTNRQTEIEKNLLEQVKANSTRIDNLERDKTAMEAAFREQLEAGARERRDIEAYFRNIIEHHEHEILALQASNIDLQHENWLLKHQAIGSGERKVIEAQATDIRAIEGAKDERF